MQQQRNKYIQYCINALAFGFVVLIVVSGSGGWVAKYNQWNSLKNKREDLTNALKAKRDDIAKIRENIERFNIDRDFVEELARRSHRVSRSDIVFVFDEANKR
jgi:cell division protein FtsB